MGKCAMSVCVVLAALTMRASAGDIMQLPEESQSGELMHPGSIALYNASGQDIMIFLASRGSGEKRFELRGNARESFSDESASGYTVRIPTAGGREVHYNLSVNNRYEIFWNADAQLWDVALIHER